METSVKKLSQDTVPSLEAQVEAESRQRGKAVEKLEEQIKDKVSANTPPPNSLQRGKAVEKLEEQIKNKVSANTPPPNPLRTPCSGGRRWRSSRGKGLNSPLLVEAEMA
eukprot:506171-Prorocentrum_minimum.AAC.1